MSVAGAVLTGGASRRLGRPKALVPVAGSPMATSVAVALAAGGCSPVILVGGDADALGVLGHPVVPDRFPGAGPLGGVYTALLATGTDVVVAACDLPGLTAEVVAELVLAGRSDSALVHSDTCSGTAGDPVVDVAVARSGGHHVPVARWNRSALDVVERSLAAGDRSLRGVLARLRTVWIEVDPMVAVDVDTPSDLEQVRRRGEHATPRPVASVDGHGDS